MAPSFNFTEGSSLDEEFNRIRYKGFFPFGDNLLRNDIPSHCRPLVELEQTFDTSEPAFDNALFLAKGYRRLLVVLLEPSDEEFSEWIKADTMGRTLEEVDWLLEDASCGKLGIGNTCIFDIRPLRFRWQREQEEQDGNDQLTYERDEQAYAAFEEMLHTLRPSVVLLCQCATSKANNTTASRLCSNMMKTAMSGSLTVSDINIEVVYGFHPSVYLNEEYLEAHATRDGLPIEQCEIALRTLLRLAFHVAINKLAGRELDIRGFADLQKSAFGRPFISSVIPRTPSSVVPRTPMSQGLRALRRIQ